MVNIHDSAYCEGRGSWVHTSQRPLNTAPVYWDEQRRQAFRRCEHVTMLRDLDDWELDHPPLGRWVGMPLVVLLRGRRPPLLSATTRSYERWTSSAGSPAATTTLTRSLVTSR